LPEQENNLISTINPAPADKNEKVEATPSVPQNAQSIETDNAI